MLPFPQYLDMNGVIHNCSHGAGTDVNTRMTEVRSSSGAQAEAACARLCACCLYFADERGVVRTR